MHYQSLLDKIVSHFMEKPLPPICLTYILWFKKKVDCIFSSHSKSINLFKSLKHKIKFVKSSTFHFNF